MITPWNAPLMLATWRVAPALAAGNTVVLKPPEWAPLTASLLADIAHEAGLPAGAFNVVQGIGEEAGAALVAHPGVARVAFTGSVATGRLVAQAAGANLTPSRSSSGASRRSSIFADADLDALVRQAVNQFDNAGQVCLAGTRLIVEESTTSSSSGSPRLRRRSGRGIRARRHRHRAADHARALRAGGRVRPARERRRREPLSAAARTRPSAACTTGRRCSPTPRGLRDPDAEVFGPVLTAQPFTDEDEAVALANGTDYGLAAILYTGDRDRARRVSERLVAGTVWVNCFFVRDLAAPFGGSRNSGIGREGGVWSFDFYADVKNV